MKPQCLTFGVGQLDGSVRIRCSECGAEQRVPASTLKEMLRKMKRFRDTHADRHGK